MKVSIWMILFFIGMWVSFSHAAPASKTSDTSSRVHALFAAGSEVRPQKDTEGHLLFRSLPNFAAGFGFQQYLFIFERATHEEKSGNASLSVERSYQDMLLWAQWRALTWNYISPIMGAGIGAYQEQVTTHLAGANSATSTSPFQLLGGANVGLSLDVPYLWLSVEARMLFGDELDPQPSIGGLVRLGVWF